MKNFVAAMAVIALALAGLLVPGTAADGHERSVLRFSDNCNIGELQVAPVKRYDEVQRITIVPDADVQQYRLERIVSPKIEDEVVLRLEDSGHCDVNQRQYFTGHGNSEAVRLRVVDRDCDVHRDNVLRIQVDDFDDHRQRSRQRSSQRGHDRGDVLRIEVDNDHHRGNQSQRQRSRSKSRSRSGGRR